MDKEDKIFNDKIDFREDRPPFKLDEELREAADKVKKIIELEEGENVERNAIDNK